MTDTPACFAELDRLNQIISRHFVEGLISYEDQDAMFQTRASIIEDNAGILEIELDARDEVHRAVVRHAVYAVRRELLNRYPSLAEELRRPTDRRER